MGTKIGKEKIQREKGYLYFIGKDGYVWAAPMKHNKSGTQRREDHWAIQTSQRRKGSERAGLKRREKSDSPGDPDGETVTSAPKVLKVSLPNLPETDRTDRLRQTNTFTG